MNEEDTEAEYHDNSEKINLMEEFFKLHILLHRYYSQNVRKFGGFGNPYRGQGRVISLLKRLNADISQKELSYLLQMRNQSLGEILVKLERSGYITRTPSEKDRRAMIVSLTEAGASLEDPVIQKSNEINSVFDCLSEDEQDQFGFLLKRITDSLEQNLGESFDMDDLREQFHCRESFESRGFTGRHHFHSSSEGWQKSKMHPFGSECDECHK